MDEAAKGVNDLWLQPVLGPPIDGFWIEEGQDLLVGRASKCDVRLADGTISREHARLKGTADGPVIEDLGSRGGTVVNDVQLEPNASATLSAGDLLRIGPWTFRFSETVGPSLSMQTIDDAATATGRIQRLGRSDIGSLAQHRLNLLIDCSERINAQADEAALAASLVIWAVDGTGFTRAAMLRGSDASEVEVIGYRDGDSSDASSATFSRSLIEGAMDGDICCMISGDTGSFGQSIADLNIHSALCAPITVDDELVGFLYLDARDQEAQVQSDAAGFCQALCRMAALAVANLRRLEMQLAQQRMEQDLAAAREAQEFMLPETQGQQEACQWAYLFKPGRHASGDLVDIVPLPRRCVALCVGDVSGKGAGAAILMAASQSFLNASLVETADPAAAVTALNAFVTARSALNKFLTLWVGIFDPEAGELRFIDAGHGHWAIRRSDGTCEFPPDPTGTIVGVDPRSEYQTQRMDLSPGDRISLFSDGVVEQQDASGEQFGMQRVLDVLAPCSGPHEDVSSLLEAVVTWAGRDHLDDDTTIASAGIVQA